MTNRNVAIVGATDDPTRYAYKALKSLQSHGYNPILVNPTKDTVDGLKCYASLRDIPDALDTITLYVRPSIAGGLVDDILAAHPHRVIMNPGTVNEALAETCSAAGIEVVKACTLVMLSAGQF